jgi:hypothetical protein
MRASIRAAGPPELRLRALLLVAVLSLGLLHAVQPLHVHDATSVGLYNEAHVLAALDSVTVDVPLPDQPPGIGIDVSRTAAPLAACDAPAWPRSRSTQPRAPPLA